MATIQKRKNKNGTISYRVMIRPDDGLPIQYKTWPTHQEAKDWAIQEEAKRRQGLYFPEKFKQKHTLAELIDRYTQDILPSIKSADDVLCHLNWWKLKLGKFTLNHVSSDLISKHRRELLDEVLPKSKKRTGGTVNRYLASLSAVLSHGVKECEWLSSNPMSRVKKLKEAEGRNRTLSPDECSRLLAACAKSANKLLLPFVILALTTGARSGELLDLQWNSVDLENGLIHLKSTKNGRPRVLAIVGDVLLPGRARRRAVVIAISRQAFVTTVMKQPRLLPDPVHEYISAYDKLLTQQEELREQQAQIQKWQPLKPLRAIIPKRHKRY